MVLANPDNRPDLPLNEQRAAEFGLAAANSYAIRALVELLDQPCGRKGFQEKLSDALLRPQEQIYGVFAKWYGGAWAHRATNPDARGYRSLHLSFTDRVRQIRKICQSTWTNSSESQSS